jgi:tetratricopeptide (TPR) repeat protein
MRIHHTIALVSMLGAIGLLYPLVEPIANPDPAAAARVALSAGDYAKAITLYTDVLQGERLDTQVLANVYQERAIARHKSGSAIQAIADYTNAIWLGALSDPQLARTLLDRGIAYVQVGELVRARHDFDNAIAKDASLADAYFGRATVVRLLGKPGDSIGDFTEALRLGHAAPALVHFGRGLAEEAMGARNQAIADYAQAVRYAPNFGPAKTKLAQLGAPLPSEQEIAAVALDLARHPPPRPATPAETLALADAGEVLTMAGTPTEEPTGAISPSPEAGPPTVLSSALPPNTQGGGPSFLRPSRDALLAEQAVAANARVSAPPEATPAPAPAAVADSFAVDAQTPTGALPPAPPLPQAAASPPAPAAAPPPAPEAPPQAPPAAARGVYLVQIGAYGDKGMADRSAAAFTARFPDIAGAHPTVIEAAQIAGRGTVYRLRIGPFASEDESRAACSALKSRAQPCVLVIPPKSPRTL